MTLMEFLDRVYVNERTIKPESERQLRMSIQFFENDFGPLDIDELSHGLLNQWVAANSRDWSPCTLKHRVNDVLAVWTYAYKIESTENQPNRLRIRTVRIPRRLPEAWTLDELQRMLDVCRNITYRMSNGVREGDFFRAIIMVGFYSALRSADLRRLRRDELHPFGKAVEQHKKHGTEVLVVVPEFVIDEINSTYPETIELVFCWPYESKAFGIHYQAMLELAGLPSGRMHGLQKLRRTAVSYGERVHRGFGASLAGHEPGSASTYRHYVDPRIVRQSQQFQLPDVRLGNDDATTRAAS